MPKVGASMANISTNFVPAPPDTYLCTLEKVEFNQKEGRNFFIMHSKILSGDESGVENAGRVIRDQISMHKKDGSENEIGSVQLKRYIEAVKPEAKDWDEATWDEFDTDEIQGGQLSLTVTIEADSQEPEKKYNRVKRVTSVN